MTDNAILFDPEKAIEQNTDPLGNKYKVVISTRYPGLYTIVLGDAHPNREVPVGLRGHWTNADRATVDLKSHLTRMWEKVESKKKPLANAGKREEVSAAAG